MQSASPPIFLGLGLALIAGFAPNAIGAASFTATARIAADPLTLNIYERDRVVASLTCKTPDSSHGLLTVFLFPPGASDAVEIAVSQFVPVTIELTIDSLLFGSQTFKTERVQAEHDRQLQLVWLSGDLSSQEAAIGAALFTAEATIQIAVDGRAISVDLGRGDGITEMFNACGEIRDAAMKAGNVGPRSRPIRASGIRKGLEHPVRRSHRGEEHRRAMNAAFRKPGATPPRSA